MKGKYELGVLYCVIYFLRRIKNLIFVWSIWKRTDMKVFSDAYLNGIKYMHIGYGFASKRGLWLEAIDTYPSGKQNFRPKIIIGNRVSVGEYVHIGCLNRIIIGDDVLMGSKIYITDHNHGVYRGEGQDSPKIPPAKRPLTEGESVVIGARCWIGEFVTILPGVTIGEGSIIGSHSTVTHDIPANSIAVGSPARVVKQWDDLACQWVRVDKIVS